MKSSLGGFRGGARAECGRALTPYYGICFAFIIIGGRSDRDSIHAYAWYPMGDMRTLLSPSLRAYVEQ